MPLKIENSCPRLLDYIRAREAYYTALRGQGYIEVQNNKLDVELAVLETRMSRVEITGALGIRLGLLVWNQDWLQLYLPRENKVYRIPSSELQKETLRRERFLKLLPFPLWPELYFESLLTRTASRDASTEGLECSFDSDLRAYKLRYKTPIGGRWIWVDGTTYTPLKVLYFSAAQNLPKLDTPVENLRPQITVEYGNLQGEGFATLPEELWIRTPAKEAFHFHWIKSEIWNSVNMKAFSWTPPKNAQVIDY